MVISFLFWEKKSLEKKCFVFISLFLKKFYSIHFKKLSISLSHNPHCLQPTNLFSISTDLGFSFVCFVLFLGFIYKRIHLVFAFLCPTYFTWHNALEVYPLCDKGQDFIVFYGWIIFHYTHTYVHHFIHSSLSGYLGYFHILAIINNATVNVGVHLFFKLVFLSSWINT